MSGRLEGKVAIVVGAGQTPGDTIGNGRATAILFAREGARVVCVDRNEASAAETVAQIAAEGGTAIALGADATDEQACLGFVAATTQRFERLDVLHNNVGIGTGDDTPARIETDAWDHIFHVNLKSVLLPCKAALPVLRAQRSGSIINVSSVAAVCSTPTVAYKASKAALNAYTQSLAIGNAKYGIRANAIMPGLMNTPMAIEGLSARLGVDKAELIARRDAMVPLGAKMGDAWDVAYAALYLASDEARFVTGIALAVDGGQSARVG
jgi:NAD(P)-dependent dehydrogenase (short-subunit alcohol dehydrogenase family)